MDSLGMWPEGQRIVGGHTKRQMEKTTKKKILNSKQIYY